MKVEAPGNDMVALFDGLVPHAATVVVKPMFGQRGAWVNGNMFMGTFGERLVVRLAEDDRIQLAEIGGERFAPMGRRMREYMLVPESMHNDDLALHGWVGRSFDYVSALPPKTTRSRSPRSR